MRSFKSFVKEEKPGLYANIHAKRARIKAGSGERMRKPGSEGAPSPQDFKDAAKTAKEEVEHLDEISAGLAKKVAQARDKSAEDYDLTPTQSRRLKMGDKGGDPDMNAAKALKSAMKRGAKNVYSKEEIELEEAISVKKQNYSWGKMVTVHHGSETSYPLHPEHQAKIKALGDGEKTSFKDETGRHVTAHRSGDTIHLSGAGTSKKTPVARSHFAEEVSPMIKAPKKEFATKADAFAHAKEKGGKVMKKTFTHPTTGQQHVSYVVKEEVELDELSRETISSYKNKASDARLNKNLSTAKVDKRMSGVAKASARLDKKNVEEEQKYYSIVHKTTKKVLSTHKDMSSAKDEHRGMESGVRAHYYVATSTKEPKTFNMKEAREKDDLPFTPDKPSKAPSAKAGKYGIGYSTVKHLARMALKHQQDKKKEVKEEKAARTRADIEKEIEHHRKQIEAISNSSPGNHPQASLQRRRMARPHVKKKEALEKELASLKEEIRPEHQAELDSMQHHFDGVKKAKEDLSYKPSTKSEAIKTIRKTLSKNPHKPNTEKHMHWANGVMSAAREHIHSLGESLEEEFDLHEDIAEFHKEMMAHHKKHESDYRAIRKYNDNNSIRGGTKHGYADTAGDTVENERAHAEAREAHKAAHEAHVNNHKDKHELSKKANELTQALHKKHEHENVASVKTPTLKRDTSVNPHKAGSLEYREHERKRRENNEKHMQDHINTMKELGKSDPVKQMTRNVHHGLKVSHARQHNRPEKMDEALRHKVAGAIGQFIGNKIDPVHGEIMRVHGEEAYRQAAYHIRKTLSNLHSKLKKHLSTGKLQTEAVKMPRQLKAYKEYTRLTGKTPEQRTSELDKVQKDLEKQRQEYIKQGIIKP